ncbi:polysaccharide pyruvyl transferase family protein [Thermophagus sp. OGC60D27]|uniref:polysaccharide pyruvyl transferase family protein n=1 Tax=Thermophagus sp. OGC60D27 TaxID=3458415 RepID=UPI0040375F1D
MRIIIFNDTSEIESNPGCYHTFSQLKKNLQKANPKSEIITFPLFFGYKKFKKLSKKNWETKNQTYKLYLKYLWQLNSKSIYKKKLKNNINKDDKIIINAEGTIHHNSIGALTLLAIAYILSKKGYKVYILNGTIEKIAPSLLKKALKRCQMIVLREPLSFNYLKQNNILNIKQGADCVFSMAKSNFNKNNCTDISKPKVLFTPGVLIPHGNMKLHQEKINSIYDSLKESMLKFKNITILQIEEKEKDFLEYAKKKGCNTIEVNDYDKKNILNLINNFDIIISARYHILIFGIILGKGIIPLDYTNTYKIKGLLKLMNLEFNPEEFSPIFPTIESVKNCIKLAQNQTA